MEQIGPMEWARGWRRGVMAAGMLIYPVVTGVGVAQYAHGAVAVLGYALLGTFCVAYVLGGICFAQGRGRAVRGLLGLMVLIFLAELPIGRTYACYLCAVVVGFAVPVLRRFVRLIVVAGALVCLLVPVAVRPWHSGPGVFEAVALVFTALTVYGYSELLRSNQALLEARAEVAALASDAERARIARDLHDLLGHSLTVITVKSGLARRLAETGSPGSVREITEVEELARQALTDVRAAVSGFRDVSLSAELSRGRETLRAAGITADFPAGTEVVDAAHQQVFGWVVREGLTNVVRHSRAGRCTITLAATWLEIADDGVGAAAVSGNGLTGLGERVAAAGGRFSAGPVEPRGWRIRVSFERGAGTR